MTLSSCGRSVVDGGVAPPAGQRAGVKTGAKAVDAVAGDCRCCLLTAASASTFCFFPLLMYVDVSVAFRS